MAKINGSNLVLKIDGVAVACSKSCSLSIEQDLPDASCKGSNGWAEHINGQKSWSIECEGLLDFSATYGGQSASTALINGTSATLLFTTGTSNDIEWTGTANVSSLSIESGMEDVVTYSASFTGTGALTQQTTS